jgi:hypothetical protein
VGRVINPEGVGKERNQLMRALAISLRELMKQHAADSATRDLAAFMVIVLGNIAKTIDRTVEPWEKRGYWLKADRFRLDWGWAAELEASMGLALEEDEFDEIARSAGAVGEKLGNIKLPQRHRLGTPWVGSWDKLKSSK